MLIFPAAGACRDGNAEVHPEAVKSVTTEIAAVLDRHTEELMALPGVVGVGQGSCDGDPCILVLVVERTRELEKKIPSRLGGFAVTIKVTGEIIAEPAK